MQSNVDIIEAVLVKVHVEDLRACRLVCKIWQDILDSKSFWKRRLRTENEKKLLSLPFYLKCAYLESNILGKNLIKNGSCDGPARELCAEKFPPWKHLGNFHENWLQKKLTNEESEKTGSKLCFCVPLSHGPNEMHQKVKYIAIVVLHDIKLKELFWFQSE